MVRKELLGMTRKGREFLSWGLSKKGTKKGNAQPRCSAMPCIFQTQLTWDVKSMDIVVMCKWKMAPKYWGILYINVGVWGYHGVAINRKQYKRVTLIPSCYNVCNIHATGRLGI
jgi:hypothetical protein